MNEIYCQFISEDKLEQCRHGWSTQSNESMNTSIAAYAPKTKTFSKTMSLTNRTCIAIGVKNMGKLLFWKKIYERLGMEMPERMNKKLKQNVKHFNAKKTKRNNTKIQEEAGGRKE